MRVIVGADHRGRQAAGVVTSTLKTAGWQVDYIGATEEEERCDYPSQAWRVGQAVAGGTHDRGVLLSGSGIGMTITANKVRGIRAVLAHDTWIAEVSRGHHDSNVICFPVDLLGSRVLQLILEKWMTTEFEGGRHARRLSQIATIENGQDPDASP